VVLKDNTIIGVFGQKGSGKSLFVKRHIIPLYKRIIILDSLGEYEHLITEDIKTFAEAIDQNYEKEYFTICYRPLDERPLLFFPIAKSQRNVLIIVEESDYYSNPYYINQHFMEIIKYGRHHLQNMVYISRTPAEISRHMTRQTDIMISFRQIEPIDLNYFKKISSEAERLPELAILNYPERIIQDKHYLILRGKEEIKKIS